MKKVIIFLIVSSIFFVSSCTKDKLTANGTLTYGKHITLMKCSSHFGIQLDKFPGKIFSTEKVPGDFHIPDIGDSPTARYTTRVYIEYRPYNHPAGCENYIEIVKITKIE